MSRIAAIEPSVATGKAHELLSAVKGKLGLIPNMTRVMANSPAVLEGYLGLSTALAGGLLTPKIREALALIVAQDNECGYCLSAHTALGKMVGLSPDEIALSREGRSANEETAAALTFARQVLSTRGAIQESDLAAIRAAGFSDGEITEIIAHVALNVLTNYFNKAADVDIDFPAVSYHKAESDTKFS